MTRIGDVGTANVVTSNKPIAYYVSLALLKKKKLNPYFLQSNIHSYAVQNEIWKRTLHIAFPKKINKNEIEKVYINYPTEQEQDKVGAFFKSLDYLITLHHRKLELLKVTKKTMLQKMFPKDGENVPKIRFSGFTDAWEPRTFDDLADYKKGPFGSAITKDMFIPKSKDSVKVYEQQNAIGKDWRLERYFITKEHAEKLKSFKVSGEDIIVSCAGTIGEIYEIPSNAESGIINQALMRIRVNNKVIDKRMFILLFSIMIDHFSSVHSNGSAIKNIPPFADLKPTIAFVPKIEEQIKIGKYFSELDNIITLHQRELNLLEKLKKSMLQQMFI